MANYFCYVSRSVSGPGLTAEKCNDLSFIFYRTAATRRHSSTSLCWHSIWANLLR